MDKTNPNMEKGGSSSSNNDAATASSSPTGGEESAQTVQNKAVDFIREALLLVDELKREQAGDATHGRVCDAIGFCVSRCYSLSEIEAYMTLNCDYPAEDARALYSAIVSGTGDIPGGEAYAKYAEVCSAKRKKAEDAKQAEELLEARRRSGKESEVHPRQTF